MLIPECTPSVEVKTVVQFDWDSEPAIHSWRIRKISNDKVQIEIIVFVDGIKEIPGKLEFNEECELNQLIAEVVLSMETILKNHGIVGYRKQWYAQDFPLSSYLQLKYYLMNNSKFPLEINNQDEWNESLESNLFEELNLIKKNIF